MTQQSGDAPGALPLSNYTAEERDALLLAGDLRMRLQRERQAATRLSSYLSATTGDPGPALRQTVPSPREPLSIEPAGEDIVLGCSSCGEQQQLSLEPTPVLLREIELFVKRHARCR